MRGLPITCSQIEDEELAVIEMGMDGLRTNSKIINNDKAIYRCNYKHRFFTYRKTSEVLKIYKQEGEYIFYYENKRNNWYYRW